MMKYATNIGLIYEIRNNPVQKLSCQIPNWQRLIFLYIRSPLPILWKSASYTLPFCFLYLGSLFLPIQPGKSSGLTLLTRNITPTQSIDNRRIFNNLRFPFYSILSFYEKKQNFSLGASLSQTLLI